MGAPSSLHGRPTILSCIRRSRVPVPRPGESVVPDRPSPTDATSRRDFLWTGAVAAVALPAVASLAACSDTKAATKPDSLAKPAGAAAPAAPAPTPRQKADA